MGTERSLFDLPEAEARSDARAEADVREGRVVAHAAVRRWLGSWGSAKRLPRPRAGD
jgi:predicted transcriptional regulator